MDKASLDPKRYIRVVSEEKCPVIESYVQSEDGLYVACAVRKPVGDGPFPAVVVFHGAPGGQGMEILVKRIRGDTGSPFWERLLMEGYVVLNGDYRKNPLGTRVIDKGDGYNRVHDAVSIIKHAKSLPYVDPLRVGVFGGSLGGATVLEAVGHVQVAAAAAGAPASFDILGMKLPKDAYTPRELTDRAIPEELSDKDIDRDKALSVINRISCPLLIVHGTADRLWTMNRKLIQIMEEAGKKPELAIFEGELHGFYFGPLRLGEGPQLTKGTLMAIERIVSFFNKYVARTN